MVNNIDRTIPEASIVLSNNEMTNQNIELTVFAEEFDFEKIDHTTFNGEPITPDSVKTRIINDNNEVYEVVYIITRNGNFSVEAVDADTGLNQQSFKTISNIDKTPPSYDYSLNITEMTNQDIEVTINVNDLLSLNTAVISAPVTVNENGKYVFTENGEYSFTIEDGAKNQVIFIIPITNIDKEISPSIWYDINTLTNKDVTATVYSDEDIFVSNGQKITTHTFTTNGEYTFEVYDEAGNTTSVTASVNWIDKIKPSISILPNGVVTIPMELSVESMESTKLNDFIIKRLFEITY